MQIGVDEFQFGVCLTKFRGSFGYPLIQGLIGGVQLLIGHLKFFGEHRRFFQRRPQLPRRTLVAQRISDQPGQL